MDFGKAFSFPFEDPDWVKKILLAALISLIPIIGQIYLVGWTLEVARRVIRQYTRLLPDVEFSESLILGFKSFVISFVYSLPAIILATPIWLVPVIASSGNDSNAMAALATIVAGCCGGLIAIYGILLILLIPAAQGSFLATGEMSAAFHLKEILALFRAAPGAYLLAVLGQLIAGIITPIGGIACGVGAAITAAYSLLMVAHLYGQAYNEASGHKLS
jgi:hypothetical protein